MESTQKITIEVNLIATFKMLAGLSRLIIEMEIGQTILDAFFLVLKKVPALSPHWLDQDGQPQVYVHAFINGDDVYTLPAGMKTLLSEGDSLDFIPPVAGG